MSPRRAQRPESISKIRRPDLTPRVFLMKLKFVDSVFDTPHPTTTLLAPDELSSTSPKPPSPPSSAISDASPSLNTEYLQKAPLINIVLATPIPGEVPVINPVLEGAFDFTLVFHPLLCPLRINHSKTAPAPPPWNTEAAPQNVTSDTHLNPESSPLQSNTLEDYEPPRRRCKSQSDLPPRPSTRNVVFPNLSSYNFYQSTFFSPSQPDLSNNYTFIGKTSMDLRYISPAMTSDTLPNIPRTGSDGGNPSPDREGEISNPPSSNSDSTARAVVDKQQFLNPTEIVPDIGLGRHRRRSSGSRDRGIGGMGQDSAPGNHRATPYPNLTASPLQGYDDLPPIPIPPGHLESPGMELGRQLDTGANLTDTGDKGSLLSDSSVSAVSIPNIATTHTVEAGERRRKADANFTCPVPGCGSTFTGHFKLKSASDRLLSEMALTCCCRPYAFA